MEEENNILETEENIEKLGEHADQGWSKYLALTTAFIAVIAAIASLQSGKFANESLVEKNNAVLYQSKASDQYNFYQAKGIKRHIAENFYSQTKDQKLKAQADRYSSEQADIKKEADEFMQKVDHANSMSDKLMERHHKAALSVTFFQIAIALSAMSALLRRKSFWYLSILLTIGGLGFFIISLVR